MSTTPEGVTARVRGKDGWAVRGAVLTVTDLTGQQAARADGDDEGLAVTGPLPPGTYTAIVIAPGYQPVARTVVAAAGGARSRWRTRPPSGLPDGILQVRSG